jgi:DNA-binding beta-propeller fold protein YncE
MMLPLSRAGGLLLSADSLYVTDRGRNEVLRIRNWTSNPSVETVASAGHGVSDPVGAALSPDRKILYVASAGVNQVLGLDVASSAVKTTMELDFRPTRLERMGPGSLLLLEKGIPGEAPARVLDSAAQKVYFIPVSAAAGE